MVAFLSTEAIVIEAIVFNTGFLSFFESDIFKLDKTGQ